MIGRRQFGIAGVSAMALAALKGSAFAHEHGEQDALDACAKACSDCQRSCDHCATHCAHEVHAGHAEHMTTLATCRDCAEFCSAAARIVAADGPFADLICGACAEACARCGHACEKFPDDEHMKMCAAECRKCEKACKDMLASAAK
jgi:microcystin-dependent protein